MSASVLRPSARHGVKVLTVNGHSRSPWLMSRAAMDVTGEMADRVASMKEVTTILDIHPADAEARKAGREAARSFLALCDELERLSS